MSRLSELEIEKRKDGYIILYDRNGLSRVDRYYYDILVTAISDPNRINKIVEYKTILGMECTIRVSEINEVRYVSSELAELLLEDEAENLLKGN